jgi:hypothetical protein
MRELLEGLHAQRRRGDAPPIEAVLDARRSRPRPTATSPRSPDSLFQSLDAPGERSEGSALQDSVEHFQQRKVKPGDLFGGLRAADPEEGKERGKGSRRKKKKRRPRPKY